MHRKQVLKVTHLAVVAAFPMSALGALGQAASGGITTKVLTFLENNDVCVYSYALSTMKSSDESLV